MTAAPDYDDLDPGIRKTVRRLRGWGFETTDSGDGVSKPNMECALPYPNVAIRTLPVDLVHAAIRLYNLLHAAGIDVQPQGPDHSTVSIQATFDPADHTAFIELAGLNDDGWP